MTPEIFKSLLAGHYAGTLTEKEKQELSALVHDPQNRERLEQLFTGHLADADAEAGVDTEELELIYQHVQLRKQATPVRRMFPYRFRWAAAAAVLLLVAAGSYFLFFNQSREQGTAQTQNTLKNDVAAPAYTKAMLILADGKEVILDSAINGKLAVQENINIIKRGDGQLIYEVNSSLPAAGALLMNTLTVPRGSRPLQLLLSDGTTIWLNSASSITYPVAFTGNDRKVRMSGEAYYEVAKDAARKFYVSANGVETEVLGTHFNVNAYEDETKIKVTLLEGAVKVQSAIGAAGEREQSAILKPEQQAVFAHDSRLLTYGKVDLEAVMAWKDGFFDFNGADIQSVMRQLARWYNLEVEYKGKITGNHFSGIISRNNNVSQVLKMLQSTGVVAFSIETDPPSGAAGKITVLNE